MAGLAEVLAGVRLVEPLQARQADVTVRGVLPGLAARAESLEGCQNILAGLCHSIFGSIAPVQELRLRSVFAVAVGLEPVAAAAVGELRACRAHEQRRDGCAERHPSGRRVIVQHPSPGSATALP